MVTLILIQAQAASYLSHALAMPVYLPVPWLVQIQNVDYTAQVRRAWNSSFQFISVSEASKEMEEKGSVKLSISAQVY